MGIAEAILLVTQILNGVRSAIAAGRTEISEADLDAALSAVDASDKALSDAIARAKARKAGKP